MRGTRRRETYHGRRYEQSYGIDASERQSTQQHSSAQTRGLVFESSLSGIAFNAVLYSTHHTRYVGITVLWGKQSNCKDQSHIQYMHMFICACTCRSLPKV